MKQNEKVYLGLGSNLGDREEYLRAAVRQLEKHDSIQPVQSSSLYETDPIGIVDQPAFYNLVLLVHTTLSPMQLLQTLLSIEQKLHRERKQRFGPRTIDLDILLYGKHCIQEEHLQVPHPRCRERSFVLLPLQEIAPNLRFPDTGERLADRINHLPEQGIRCIGPFGWRDKETKL